MKFKKVLLITLLLAVLTMGAVSAADNADTLAVDNSGDDQIAESSVDENSNEAVGESSADDNLMDEGDITADDWQVLIECGSVHYDYSDAVIVRIFWPSDLNVSDRYVQVSYNGTKTDAANDVSLNVQNTSFTVRGNEVNQKIITLEDFGMVNSQFTEGDYSITISHDSETITTFDFRVFDERYNTGWYYDWNDKYNYFEPGTFNFKVLTTEVDIDNLIDSDIDLFSFVFPTREDINNLTGNDYIYAHPLQVLIENQDLTKDYTHYYSYYVKEISTYPIGFGNTRVVTLNELLDGQALLPGNYKIIVLHDEVIGRFYLKATKTYAADDFIAFYDEVTESDDLICYVYDSTLSDLNGTITVYVNDKQAYKEEVVGELNYYHDITLGNLTGNFYNGNYTIKVVYEKANGMQSEYEKSNGKVFSSEKVVSFVGISDMGNIETKIATSAVTTTYNTNKYLVATLTDGNGNPIQGADVYINIMGVSYPLTTDKDGKIKQSLSNLPPKTHTIKFVFNGDEKYFKSSKSVKVTVKKATPKITAAQKTFKKSVKTKMYTITLKNNVNKVMKNTWVTLKVNKKTFKAKTNSKGQATFKITNLNKKGTFTAEVKYAGSQYYNSKTVKPKIIVK